MTQKKYNPTLPDSSQRSLRQRWLPITLVGITLITSGCAGTALREAVAPQEIDWQPPAQIRAATLEGREAAWEAEQQRKRAEKANGVKVTPVQTAQIAGGELPEGATPAQIENLIRSLENESGEPATTKVHESSILTADAPTSLWDRIRSGFAMPELRSDLVARREKFYLSQPDYMQRMFARSSRYLYHIVEEIEQRSMPMEIALLPFVESAMNPKAVSHAKAAGLWQFIPSTGRAYNLKQNWWADNRRDVVQSTRAALDYLQMLHKMHNGDWFLALASYNWGEGSVKRAIRNNKLRGRPTDYLNLRMPAETRHYVPKLMALRNILQNPARHGVALPDLPNEPYFVVLEKTRAIDLKLAAKFAGLSVKDFVALNPAHNRPVIFASRNSMIKIPTANLDRFLAAMEDHEAAGRAFVSWRPYTLRKNETIKQVAKRTGVSSKELLKANGLSSRRRLLAGTRILVPSRKASGEQIAKFAGPRVVEVIKRPAAYHVVKRRDTLSRIARRWGLSTRTLKKWNGLRSNTVRRGQRLLVRQPAHQTVETAASGKRKILARHGAPRLQYASGSDHRVKSGQTLSGIARKYGVSMAKLRSWNGLRGDRIRIGQRLRVREATRVVSNKGSLKSVTYKVRAGDNLGKIARKHKVRISDLRAWNSIKGNLIKSGQKLIVAKAKQPTRSANSKKSGRIITAARPGTHKVRKGDTLIRIASRYGMTVSQVRKLNAMNGSAIRIGQNLKVATAAQSNLPRRSTIRHRVRSGDTLIGIARRYGVTVTDLREWNAIKGDSIRSGQRLTIERMESADAEKPRSRG